MQNWDMTLKWIFIVTNFVVEIPSAVFDQLSSVQKHQYALISMIMSFATVLTSVIDLAVMGRRGVEWMWRDNIPWFYSPNQNYKPLGSFADIVGLVCGIFQCVFATMSYAFLSQHADNPMKISIWPLIFAFGVLYSRFPRTNQRNISDLKHVVIHPNSPSESTLHGQQPPETPLLPDNKVLAGFAEQVTKAAKIAREQETNENEIQKLYELENFYSVFSN